MIFSAPKLVESNSILFPQGFYWDWTEVEQAESSFKDVLELWHIANIRGFTIGIIAATGIVIAGRCVYKLVQGKKKANN